MRSWPCGHLLQNGLHYAGPKVNLLVKLHETSEVAKKSQLLKLARQFSNNPGSILMHKVWME